MLFLTDDFRCAENSYEIITIDLDLEVKHALKFRIGNMVIFTKNINKFRIEINIDRNINR